MKKNENEFKIAIVEMNDDDEPMIKIIETYLMPTIQKNILMKNCGGSKCEFSQDDETENNFFIRVYSSPYISNSYAEISSPEIIFGEKLSRNEYCFPTSLKGITISDKGFDIAELFPNHLYFHGYFNGNIKIYEETFKKVATYLNLPSVEDVQRHKNEEILKMQQATTTQFVKTYNAGIQSKLKHQKKIVKEIKSELAENKSQYINSLKELTNNENMIHVLETSKKKNRAEIINQLNNIKKFSQLEYFTIHNNVVNAYTKPLFCKNPNTDKIHDIGKFRIYLNLNSGKIRWFNQTRKVDAYTKNMQAPHVFPSGKACMGNVGETFCDMLANYDIGSAILLGIQFIESVNTSDDAGKYIENWPKVSKAEVTKIEDISKIL